jgi:Protein of unknown function (DUF3078)
MKKIVALALLFATAFTTTAQDLTVLNLRKETDRTIRKDADTTKWTWKRGGLVSANLAQGSLSNWAAGGDNFSMSFGAYVNYYSFFKKGKHIWDNSLDFNLGFVQTTSLGSRKNDDRLDLLSKYGYSLGQKWYLSGLVSFRSQFFDGYTFGNNVPDFSSTLLSPAYITVSAGFDHKPNDYFSMFISPLTSRWIIVADPTLSKRGLYGVDSGKHSMNEIGAFATVNYNRPIAKNITYKGRVDLFSNYKKNPQNVDMYMTNMIAFKINRFLSATYSLDMIYDDDAKLFGDNKNSPALQIKSLIGIGYLMNFKPTKK